LGLIIALLVERSRIRVAEFGSRFRHPSGMRAGAAVIPALNAPGYYQASYGREPAEEAGATGRAVWEFT